MLYYGNVLRLNLTIYKEIFMNPKLKLVHNNKELKTYYVPYTIMQVDFYAVNATSPEQALMKANDGKFGRLEKRITLQETQSNAVYTNSNQDYADVLTRDVVSYDIKESSYDEVSGSS